MIEEHDLAGPTGKFALGDSDEPEVVYLRESALLKKANIQAQKMIFELIYPLEKWRKYKN